MTNDYYYKSVINSSSVTLGLRRNSDLSNIPVNHSCTNCAYCLTSESKADSHEIRQIYP